MSSIKIRNSLGNWVPLSVALMGGGNVATVNGIQPDSNGEITLDAAVVNAIPVNEKGVANGVATLDGDGNIEPGQLEAITLF